MNLEAIKKSILVLDLETSSFYPGTDKPIDISTNFEEYVIYAKVKWFGAYSYLHDEYVEVPLLGNEEIIQDYIKQHAIIVGFNNEEFDTPILYNNNLMPEKKRYLQVDCLVTLGSATYQRHDGLPFKNRGKLMGYKFKKNSLKCIAETMELVTQKGDIDYKIFYKDSWTDEETVEIKKYLHADVQATKEMFDVMWNFWMPFTNFLSEKNVLNLSWIRASIASLRYKGDCHTLGVEETYAEHSGKAKEEMGGRVIEPKYQEATGVWYVDFGSLYPWIRNMCAIDNEIEKTIIVGNNKDNTWNAPFIGPITNKLWHGNDVFQVKGYYDISGQSPIALKSIENLTARAKMKIEDPDNPMIYAIKIYENAGYGALRSSIFEQIHTPNAGWDICWLGQQIQKLTEDIMSEFGFETIAGDTDSIFIQLVDQEISHHMEQSMSEEEYVKSCLKEVLQKIKANVPFPSDTFSIDIENYLEYVMWPFSLQPVVGPDGKNMKNDKGRLIKELKGKKKNYVYMYKTKAKIPINPEFQEFSITKDGIEPSFTHDGFKPELKIKIMGLPIKKDNATILGKRILDETLIPTFLEKKTAKVTQVLMDNIIEDYLSKPDAIKTLAREFKVKPAMCYKKPSQIQSQISEGYFEGQAGVINLIKTSVTGDPNKKGYRKVGRAGQGSQYCTYEEAVENKLGIKDLDLTKLKNELEPFVVVE